MKAVKKLFFVLLVLFLFSSLTKTMSDYFKNMNFYEGYKAEYEKEKKRNITLKTQIIKNNDPYELEKTIRNNLNLTKENEVAILLPRPTEGPSMIQPTQAPIFKQWVEVFFQD